MKQVIAVVAGTAALLVSPVAAWPVQAAQPGKTTIQPTIERYWWGVRVKLNKQQTQMLAAGAVGAFGGVGLVSGAVASALAVPASDAISRGRCVVLTYRWIGLVGQTGTYSC